VGFPREKQRLFSKDGEIYVMVSLRNQKSKSTKKLLKELGKTE
jgi:hypothetical protein